MNIQPTMRFTKLELLSWNLSCWICRENILMMHLFFFGTSCSSVHFLSHKIRGFSFSNTLTLRTGFYFCLILGLLREAVLLQPPPLLMWVWGHQWVQSVSHVPLGLNRTGTAAASLSPQCQCLAKSYGNQWHNPSAKHREWLMLYWGGT